MPVAVLIQSRRLTLWLPFLLQIVSAAMKAGSAAMPIGARLVARANHSAVPPPDSYFIVEEEKKETKKKETDLVKFGKKSVLPAPPVRRRFDEDVDVNEEKKKEKKKQKTVSFLTRLHPCGDALSTDQPSDW